MCLAISERKTPSFKLNLVSNTWVDFGENDFTGCEKAKVVCGDSVDLVKRIKGCSIKVALDFLAGHFSNYNHIQRTVGLKKREKQEDKFTIMPIESKTLFDYAAKRRIPKSILIRFCKEVHYFNYKQRKAIGFRNESNGWEVNSEQKVKSFKRCFGRKDITLINEGKLKIWVTEGFFDFLSLLTLRNEFDISNDSFLILNGVGMAERALQFLRNYEKVNLLLDNDNAGNEVKIYFKSNLKEVEDFSFRYQNFNDLNEFLRAKY